ncbi:hypothetical protein ACKKBG_A36935 [Auxenochlorella protothecoides x Auxenochlorella symbiontica]|uniref:Protein SYS1-like protein n=1 Tax=Auxenochlorella protothecoides TaxID=3075 RepID=A0A1D2AFH5_AUXPR
MLYGTVRWDPLLIVVQIVAFQCYFYGTLGLLLFLLTGPYVPDVNLFHVFDWRWIQLKTFVGAMVILAFVITSVLNAVFLRLMIRRAKKCLDFTATLYGIHLILVWSTYGLPRTKTWWICNLAFLAITTGLGEWLCMQKELQDIPMSSLSTAGARIEQELVRQIPVVTILS